MSNTEHNPLLSHQGIPNYQAIQASHVSPAVDDVLTRVLAVVEDLENNAPATWDGLFRPMENVSEWLSRVWGPVGHLMSVANNAELREAYQANQPRIVELSLRISQSQKLYEKMKATRDHDSFNHLTPGQKRVIEKNIESAELSGIGLQGDQRKRFNEIANKLSQLSTRFADNVMDATKAWDLVLTNAADVKGMPSSFLNLASHSYNQTTPKDGNPGTPELGPWRVTLDAPSYVPFVKHCPNRTLRETVYKAFVSRAAEGQFDNTDAARKILSLRQEKAKLLGFGSYAELSTARKMAGNVDAVETLLHHLRSASLDKAKTDDAELLAFAQSKGESLSDLLPWDVSFWAERQQEEKFAFKEEDLRPYFALPTVLDGLFDLVHRIFGITVRVANGQAPVWNDDVTYYVIEDEQGQHMAAFFLDAYSRPENKRGGAWMNECTVRWKHDDGMQHPIAYLVCNFPPPVGEQPALLSFRDVETLFHEFGHGLQHMLTQVDIHEVSGINGIEWDAVELPSQFMENWCYHKATLQRFARHFQTSEPLPDELFEKVAKTRTYRSAHQMLRQLHFGLTDMELHHRYDPNSDETIFDVDRRIAKDTLIKQPVPEDRFLCAFSHIFAGGYSAGYFSYKWAEVLSADAFSAFEDVGLDNESEVAKVGRRFRDTVLSLGGSIHPMEVFKSFRGREPKPDALLSHSGLKTYETA